MLVVVLWTGSHSDGFSLVPAGSPTWWIRLAGLAVMATLVALTYHIATRAVREKNDELGRANHRLADINVLLKEHISWRKKTERERQLIIEELEAKNSEMERFTYTVSHDLKSPLITIQGFLGMLEKDTAAGSAERMKDDMARIQSAVEKMSQLLDELLELSRIGRLVNPPQRISMVELAQAAVEINAGRIAARDIEVDIDAELPAAFGDQPRLLEVLQNLIDNAAKFLGDRPSPRIEIGFRQQNDETIYYVKDNGGGIDPRYQEKIFGLFERLDQSIEGTGIGLALVKRIIDVHGGRIWVESEGLGHGATFCFALPPPQD